LDLTACSSKERRHFLCLRAVVAAGGLVVGDRSFGRCVAVIQPISIHLLGLKPTQCDRQQCPEYQTTISEIGDELADILYCVIRIADHYQINLEAAHIQARRNELRYVGVEPDF